MTREKWGSTELSGYVALGKDSGSGMVYVYANERNRHTLGHDSPPYSGAFLQFVNSDDLSGLMSAIDAMLNEYPYLPIIPDAAGFIHAGETEDVKTGDISGLFPMGESRSTRYRREKKQQAELNRRAFSASTPQTLNGGLPGYTQVYSLADIVQAKNDLQTACLMLAWILGLCDFETAFFAKNRRHEPGGVSISLITESAAKQPKTLLGSYYKSLFEQQGNLTNTLGLGIGDIGFLSQKLCKEIERSRGKSLGFTPADSSNDGCNFSTVVSSYVHAVFNVMLSETRLGLSFPVPGAGGMELYTDTATHLAGMYGYFARGLTKKRCPGRISVCPYCGKFFTMQRSRAVYCGKSCKESARRKKEKERARKAQKAPTSSAAGA